METVLPSSVHDQVSPSSVHDRVSPSSDESFPFEEASLWVSSFPEVAGLSVDLAGAILGVSFLSEVDPSELDLSVSFLSEVDHVEVGLSVGLSEVALVGAFHEVSLLLEVDPEVVGLSAVPVGVSLEVAGREDETIVLGEVVLVVVILSVFP